jgi:hypothetical protein
MRIKSAVNQLINIMPGIIHKVIHNEMRLIITQNFSEKPIQNKKLLHLSTVTTTSTTVLYI